MVCRHHRALPADPGRRLGDDHAPTTERLRDQVNPMLPIALRIFPERLVEQPPLAQRVELLGGGTSQLARYGPWLGVPVSIGR